MVDVRLLVRVGVDAPPLPELECGERESPGDALSLDPLQADALELLADVRRERLSRAGVGGRRRTRTLLDRPKIPAYESVPVGKEGVLQAIGRVLRGGAVPERRDLLDDPEDGKCSGDSIFTNLFDVTRTFASKYGTIVMIVGTIGFALSWPLQVFHPPRRRQVLLFCQLYANIKSG